MNNLSIITKVKLSVAISLMIVLSPQVSFAHKSHKTIILNTTGNAPLNDKQMHGFMDLIAVEAFKRIGVTLKTVSLPAERGLLNANKHKIHGEMSRIAGIQNTYANLVQVPEKIMDWEFVAVGKSKLNTQSGWKSLTGKQVAFINGWKILEKYIAPVTDITKVKGPDALFRLLQSNRADFIVYEHWASEKYIKDLSLENVYAHFPALVTREMFIYLHKDHAQLVDKLATALKNMKSDGTYNKIKKRTLKHYMKHQ